MSEEQAVEQTVTDHTPLDVSEIIQDLQGFGIEENEEIFTLSSGKRVVRFKFSNISSEDDLEANLQNEETKGYDYFQRVKINILSRAISWINGVDLTALKGADQIVKDPKTGALVNFRVALRNTIAGWGVEAVQVLWKALMVHMQGIEDRLFGCLPDSAVLTEVEMRYKERTERELEEITQSVLRERINQVLDEETPPEDE